MEQGELFIVESVLVLLYLVQKGTITLLRIDA